jgi:hypothetical protein
LNGLLNPNRPAHIWLLHWLFLDAINKDVDDWVNAWNSHKITLQGEPDRSPRDMYLFGMVSHGPRGTQPTLTSPTGIDEERIEDLASYGVDEEIMGDPALFRHFLENNPDEGWPADVNGNYQNPFDIHGLPATLSEVICEVVDVPLPGNFVQELHTRLLANPGISLTSQNMTVRRLLWQNALHFCRDIFNTIDGLPEWCVCIILIVSTPC